MGDSVVIVALPAVDDPVNRVSSEKVAHLTMIYLGEAELSAEAILYVQHACSEFAPFGLSVDHRGTLGDDEADVVFFENTAWDMKRVKEFRHHLLLNDEIKRAYDSADQYPEWIPHLTLGYPETPAGELEDHQPIRYVNFDRVAVWTGDYEGPEFRLKRDNTVAEVAMSSTMRGAEAAEDILAHYGVKGMKWGVRRAENAQKIAGKLDARAGKLESKAERNDGKLGNGMTTRAAKNARKDADRQQKYADKLGKKQDEKWEKSVYTMKGAVAVHNKMADYCNARIGALNDKYPDADLSKQPYDETTQSYFNEVMSLQSKGYEYAVREVHGASPTGKKEARYIADDKGERIEIVSRDVQHAESDEPDLVVLVKLSADSTHIVEMNQAEQEIAHSDDAEAFIAHYGVKGMRWGVRKDESASKGGASSGPTAVVVTQKKPGSFAKAQGGQRHPAHEDAINALAARQVAKKSTTDALSNAELRKAVERMNLERQYRELEFQADRRSKGRRFAAGLFGYKRYGKKRPYTDAFEETGEETRKAVKEAPAQYAPVKT